MWAAYFQADGEHRHTISVRKYEDAARWEMECFIERMTNPEVGVWWAWCEEVTDDAVRDTV